MASNDLYQVSRAVSEPYFRKNKGTLHVIRARKSTGIRYNFSHYRFKIFKSRGASLVLLWGFIMLFVFHFLATTPEHESTLLLGSKNIGPVVILCMSMLLYPILGWLADVKCGRYRVIKAGLWTMWLASILFCIASAVFSYCKKNGPFSYGCMKVTSHGNVRNILRNILYMIISLGIGASFCNVIQFGVDQLQDASSSEITSFFRWFGWLWFLSGVTSGLTQSCFCPEYEPLGHLLFPTLLTVAIVSDYLCNHCLTKEPTAENPLPKVLKILRYAMKNKYPRLPNVLTESYEDEPYSRIDLAKDKYGGPFSTEQVEDVKTFLRMTAVVIVWTSFGGLFLVAYPAWDKVAQHLTDTHGVQENCQNNAAFYNENCFTRVGVIHAGDVFMVVVFPLYEFIFHPFLRRCFRVSILRRASLGVALLVLSFGVCTAIEFVANHQHLQHHQQEANLTMCPLASNYSSSTDTHKLPLDYKWMVLPEILKAASQFLIATTGSEFVCAQCPQPVKGLLYGLTFGGVGLFTAVSAGLMKGVSVLVERWLSSSPYGCLSWYLLIALGLLLFNLFLIWSVFKCYKKRTRDS